MFSMFRTITIFNFYYTFMSLQKLVESQLYAHIDLNIYRESLLCHFILRISSRKYVEVFEASWYIRNRDSSCIVVNRLKHEIGDVKKLSHYFIRMRVLIGVVLPRALLEKKQWIMIINELMYDVFQSYQNKYIPLVFFPTFS